MILKEYNLSIRLPQERTIDTGIVLVQNDKDVYKLNIRVFDGVTEITYSQVTSATITFAKSDKNVVQGDMQVEADKLTYVLGTNEIASSGKLLVSIQLWGATERLSTARFAFQVEGDLIMPSAVQSTSEFPILQRVKQDVDAIVPLLPTIEQTVQEMPAIRVFFDTAATSENTRQNQEAARQNQEAARQNQEAARQSSIADIEDRFYDLTVQQQQEAEVIDARMGKTSLRANLEAINTDIAAHMADNAHFFKPGGSLNGVINFNTLIVNRVYGVLAIDQSSTGAPPEEYGTLFCFDGLSASPVQWYLSTSNSFYTRVNAGGVWSAWAQK